MRRLGFVTLAVILCLGHTNLFADDIGVAMAESSSSKIIANETDSAESPIRKAIESYVKAFNSGDAKSLASHWKEGGEFTLPSGATLSGQEEMVKTFSKYFEKSKGTKLELVDTEVSLISPSVGIESGIARLISPEGKVNETEYQAVHIKTAKGWKIDSLEEQELAEAPPSNYEKLHKLEWMIGQWIDQGDNITVTTNCRWTSNQNFIIRTFRVVENESVSFEGTQVIGWDASKDTIRSWLFDSDGGFGVGMWTQDGNTWVVRTLSTLSDGRKASATNIYEQVNDQTMTFRSIGRQVDGELMPKIAPITVTRQ